MSGKPPAIPRPLKRTRAEVDGSDAHLPRSPSSPAPSHIKSERSPSPLLSERRLVTSGTKRFAPIPNECLPSCTGYRQNRIQWAARCVKELEALSSLIPERKLFRDDGLVIDWRSHVPVWSDTLEPDPQDLAATIMLAHRSNALWHLPPALKEPPLSTVSVHKRPTLVPSISDTKSPSKKRLPAPPLQSSKHRSDPSRMIRAPSNEPGSSSPCPERPRVSTETDGETRSRSRDGSPNPSDRTSISSDIPSQHGQFGVSPGHSSVAGSQSITPNAPSTAEEWMSEMTLNYLRRYVQTYESDRASLASAYANNASFGYRTFQKIYGASSSPQCFFTGSKRTRLDIVTTLLTLPSLHLNAQRLGIAQLEYDIYYLGAKLGMFVRKEADVEDAAIEGVWPVTALAHQILVFPA